MRHDVQREAMEKCDQRKHEIKVAEILQGRPVIVGRAATFSQEQLEAQRREMQRRYELEQQRNTHAGRLFSDEAREREYLRRLRTTSPSPLGFVHGFLLGVVTTAIAAAAVALLGFVR